MSFVAECLWAGREPKKSCFVSTECTKSTRVRVEILKCIGMKVKELQEGRGFDLIINKFDITLCLE